MHSGGETMSHFARKALGLNSFSGFAAGGTVKDSRPYIVGENPCGCHLPHSGAPEIGDEAGTHFHIDSRGSSDPEGVAAAVKRAVEAMQPQVQRIPEPQVVRVPRLWIWVPPQSLEAFKAGRAGWLPAAVAGTAWDADQWRTQYRARGLCTLWVR